TKYVNDILHKFDMDTNKSAPTPFEPLKIKDKNLPNGPVNVHLYRSMIGSLMYLTASKPDITFAMSACARNQVSLTVSNLNAVKRIFKYIKGHPKLGLWYPRDSPFDLEAFSDSDFAGAVGDRKSTTGGCQFIGKRLISWQCKKQTIVATSSCKAVVRQYEGPDMPLLDAMLPQVAQTNPLEGPPMAPQADEPMPDPAHAPNVEELIPSLVLEPVVQPVQTPSPIGSPSHLDIPSFEEEEAAKDYAKMEKLISLADAAVNEPSSFVTPSKTTAADSSQKEDISPSMVEAAQILTEGKLDPSKISKSPAAVAQRSVLKAQNEEERKKRLADLSKSNSEYAKQVSQTMETSHAEPAPQVPAT
nr:putative ribonuclease H-like domain-containing protein [Tanacetum cinerariifolium]